MALRVGHFVEAADEHAVIIGTFKPTTMPPGVNDPLFGQTNSLFADVGARELYAYSRDYNFLAAYDLDTLKPLGPGLQLVDQVTTHYVDPTGRGLFVAFSSAGLVRIDQYAAGRGGIVKVGTVSVPQLSGATVGGLYRQAGTPVVWAIASPGVGITSPGAVQIAQIDLRGFTTGGASVSWTQPISGCTLLTRAHTLIPAGFGYSPKSNSLVFGCAEPSSTFFRPPTPRGTGKLALVGDPATASSQPGDFALFPHAGEFARGDAVFDPVSGRLLTSAYSSVTSGTTMFVFDSATETYVGGVSAGGNELQQLGFDVVAGRLYALSPTHGVGLIMADIRPTPSSQGVVVPYLGAREKKTVPEGHVATDGATRRLFLRHVGFQDWLVVRDELPTVGLDDGVDPDTNTTDVAEQEGVTEAAYFGAAQGFGSVIRQVGGFEAITTNYTGFAGLPVVVQMGTRELRSAYLNQFQLGNDEAVTSVITADVDRANTRQDLTNLRPPDQEDDPDTEEDEGKQSDPFAKWPHQPAACADFGGSPATVRQSTALASCHAKEHLVEASATDRSSDANSVVVSDTLLDAKSRLDPQKGVVATIHANARGVSILGGLLHIGEVDVVAEAWAKGRPGTADATYTRTVKNVFVGGRELCSQQCDPKAVADEVNALLGPRGLSPNAIVKVDFPEPDTTYLNGSRKGYQAIVQASPLQHIEDVLLNEQPEDRIEVPGMTITISQDNIKPSRTAVYLAGVATEAHYGISLLGASDSGDGDLGAGDGIADLGGIAAEGPLFGLPPVDPGDVAITPLGPGPASVGGDNPVGTAGRLLLNGIGRMLDLLPIWGILLIPVYLSARRWLLLQRSTLIGGKS